MDLSLVLKITLTIKQSTLRVKFINNTIQKKQSKKVQILLNYGDLITLRQKNYKQYKFDKQVNTFYFSIY
ncbi:hypothetical protein UB37_06820 [Photobacterium iliopiscarium]|nr:hypothetical protein UB37_06820 [Photobacterium iliopiscarium]